VLVLVLLCYIFVHELQMCVDLVHAIIGGLVNVLNHLASVLH
jgi:hypothetical protein